MLQVHSLCLKFKGRRGRSVVVDGSAAVGDVGSAGRAHGTGDLARLAEGQLALGLAIVELLSPLRLVAEGLSVALSESGDERLPLLFVCHRGLVHLDLAEERQRHQS